MPSPSVSTSDSSVEKKGVLVPKIKQLVEKLYDANNEFLDKIMKNYNFVSKAFKTSDELKTTFDEARETLIEINENICDFPEVDAQDQIIIDMYPLKKPEIAKNLLDAAQKIDDGDVNPETIKGLVNYINHLAVLPAIELGEIIQPIRLGEQADPFEGFTNYADTYLEQLGEVSKSLAAIEKHYEKELVRS